MQTGNSRWLLSSEHHLELCLRFCGGLPVYFRLSVEIVGSTISSGALHFKRLNAIDESFVDTYLNPSTFKH